MEDFQKQCGEGCLASNWSRWGKNSSCLTSLVEPNDMVEMSENKIASFTKPASPKKYKF